MTNKEAKNLLVRHNEWMQKRFLGNYQHEKIIQALDIAVQCLEDSIEGFQLMEAVDEVNKKLEIKRACRHPKNKTWFANGDTFCEECEQFLI